MYQAIELELYRYKGVTYRALKDCGVPKKFFRRDTIWERAKHYSHVIDHAVSAKIVVWCIYVSENFPSVGELHLRVGRFFFQRERWALGIIERTL